MWQNKICKTKSFRNPEIFLKIQEWKIIIRKLSTLMQCFFQGKFQPSLPAGRNQYRPWQDSINILLYASKSIIYLIASSIEKLYQILLRDLFYLLCFILVRLGMTILKKSLQQQKTENFKKKEPKRWFLDHISWNIHPNSIPW